MFKRKQRRPFLKNLSNSVWPTMGLRRYGTYVKQRIVRLSDSPRRIALGLSFGIAASFNPYVGTHIIQACLLAYLFRANLVAAALGTIVGNPSTFPFFWWVAIMIGNGILGWFGLEGTGAVTHGTNFSDLFQVAHEDPLHILLPWTLGAYVIAILIIAPCYAIFYPLIKAAKVARAKLVARKKKAIKK